jgi:putative nucleotidyltransferase with HDIG domain
MAEVSSSARMGSITVEEVLSQPKTSVNLYLHLSDRRYVLVAKAGGSTEPLFRYQQRKVLYFYIRDSDFTALFETSLSMTNALLNSGLQPNPMLLSALEPGVSALYSEFGEGGFDEETLAHSRMIADATVGFCSSDLELQKIVQGILNMKNNAEQHSLMVSSFATMIALSLGWRSPVILQKLALGGFLHDVGLVKIPSEISAKSEAEMTKDELVIYRSHIELGTHQLASFKKLPSDVSLMIAQHHELADGTGYPQGTKDLFMSPLGRVLSAANALADITSEEAHRQGGIGIDQAFDKAVKAVTINNNHLFNKDVLKAIMNLSHGSSGKKVA